MDELVILLLIVGLSQVNSIDLESKSFRDDTRLINARPERTKLSTVEVGANSNILDANKDSMRSLREGDIQIQKARNTLNDVYSSQFWNDTKVPMIYGSDTTLLTKAAVDEARREYELRTCFSFPERTDEENYLEIRVLDGCWSYVGVQGGTQTVSIGRGCEQMATIVHEFMHAIGVWHEQSRADRDDYIEINYDAISPDLAYNFDNQEFNETDDRRVPYDYNSVMHYDKYAFSDDGNVTIQTRDPAFEDVIGQRSGFSEGDVTKISRMYGCSDTLRITNSVNFEEANSGGYSQYGLNTDVDWIKHDIAVSDTNGPTTKYLPTFDSTFGVQGKGSFMYLDTSKRIPGLTGAMKSMRYTTNVAKQCLEYSYLTKLNAGSTAVMYVYLAQIDDVTGDIISYGDPIRIHNSHSGDMDIWWTERMTIAAPAAYKLVFWAKTGAFYNDIIAIDDVSVVDKECDTSFFQVYDYTSFMTSYDLDEYVVSPVMYTAHPGYAYQLVVYPSGLQSAVDSGYSNYMGVFFRLVGGIYDDALQWPFDKQFVRLVVTDQGPNPTTRMNYYLNFLTEATSTLARAYLKPDGIGSPNLSVGWRAFMNNNLLKTRNYLKQSVAYFSVQVTDMRSYDNGTISAQLSNPLLRQHGREREASNTYEGIEFENDVREPDETDHSYHEDKDDEEGMISVEMATVMILVSAAIVFITMSIVICVVAKSYGSQAKVSAYPMNDSGYLNSFSIRSDQKQTV